MLDERSVQAFTPGAGGANKAGGASLIGNQHSINYAQETNAIAYVRQVWGEAVALLQLEPPRHCAKRNPSSTVLAMASRKPNATARRSASANLTLPDIRHLSSIINCVRPANLR